MESTLVRLFRQYIDRLPDAFVRPAHCDMLTA
jgi:hypothetical protein